MSDITNRLSVVASDIRKSAKRRKRKKPTKNERGNLVLTPDDLRAIEKKKDWEERNLRPGGRLRNRGGPHSDQFEKGHSRRDRKRTKQRLHQRQWRD